MAKMSFEELEEYSKRKNSQQRIVMPAKKNYTSFTYRTSDGRVPDLQEKQSEAYKNHLRAMGLRNELIPFSDLSATNEWKGFGVNDPDKTDWKENAPANLVDLIKMQYDNPSNQTGFAAGSVAGASAPSNDELVAFRTELSNSPDIAMRYRWANASDEDVAAELQRRKQAELQNQEYQRLMEENAKNMTLDDYIDPSYRLNDFDKTRAQEIIDAFYEKYPKDGNWLTGAYSPNTRKAMYNDPDMQKIVILENKLNSAASLVYGAKNALPIDPFGKTYENAVEKLYDAVGADQSAYDTLHNTMEGTRSASSNAQTQNPVAYLGGYMGTNIGLYKGGKDIMLGLPGIGKGLKAAGGAISNAASKVPVVGSTLGRVLTADRVAGFLGDSALDLALDTIPNEVVTGLEEGESAAQIAKDAAGNMAQNALFNVAGEVVPATIKGTSNLITRGQMNRIADALDDGAKLTAEQISEYNRLAAKVGEIGSEDWLNVNMAKYADEMPVKNAAQPIATGTEASVPSMADMFPLGNKTPVQSETDALVNAFYNNTLTNAQIETLKPGGKNRAAFEAATGLTLPETASKTRALLKLGAEESIDGTLKTEYNGVNRGVQNGTANPASASVASGEGIPLERQGFGSDSNVASGRQYTGGNRGTVSVLNNNVNGGVQNEPTGAERVSGVFENTMPVGPGMGSGHGQPGELAGGNQVLYRVLNNDRTTSDALMRVGSAYTDLHDTTAQPQVFTAALDDAIKANKHGLMVSSKTPQELADSGAVTFMTNDGLAGAAVTADGDIEAVFKNPASQIKRASAPLMLNAIENGGRKLDCYGIDLVQNYNKFGFEPVARVAWNPEYAPDGWTYGPKDVYVMKLADGLDADGVKARLGFSESDGGFHKWTQPELDALPEMDYDAALAYRDSLLEQGAKPVANRRADVDTGVISADNKRNGGVLNGQQEDGRQGGRFGLAGALSYDGAAETAGRTVAGEGSESSKTHRRLDETAKALFEDRRNADIARIRRIGEAEIKTIPAVQAEYTQGTKDALQFFSEYGIIPEVIQGPGILKVNGTYAFMNGDAQTLRDGTVLLRNDASLPAREIAAHEAMHHMQRVKKKLYEPALEAMQESGINPIGQNGEINPLLKSYLNVYTAEYDGDLPLENLTTLYRELSAQLAGRLQNDPHEAQEVFGDLFFDYTGVAEAINSSLSALKADAQSAQRQLGTSLSETVSAKPLAERTSELYGQNTVGAAERNEHSFSALQNTYGTIKPGENPARVVDVPKGTNGKDKVRQFTRTAMEAKATPDELIPLFEQNVEDGLFSYNVKKDKPALDAAVRTITDKGWAGALAQWRDVVEGRTPAGKGNITLGQLLYAEAAKAGDTELAMQLAAEVAAEGTRAGQTVQALRLLKKMTPEGQLYYVNRVVDNLNRDIKAGNRTGIGVNWKTKRAIQSGEKTVEIPNYLAEQLLNAKTESEITDASTAIMKNVADQLPADWATKWNSWRYLAMLGNVRTHIRNIAGNAIFWPARQIKNMTGSWLEQLFVREPAKRTKAILNPFNDADKSRMSFAKNDFDQSMKTVVQGTGKLNPESVIRQNQTVFTSKAMKPIETLRKANSAALEWEDTVFSKNAYVDSMAGFMKARGLTEADMTGRTLEQARTYAINQAQKATYRDASALAKKISDLANTNAATRLVVGGTMPFTTTPINIAKRGIEYSPAGIAKAITYDLYQLQKGNMTATDVVEDLASGLTGTGIVALGAALASMGFLTGGGEDNKKEEQFKDMQGVQNYALQIGDSSYTIDWLAPISLPLFVGVETWNAFQEDGEFSLARVLDTMTSITEPMMNLTLLQGINSAIKTAGYSDNPVPDIMLNAAVGYAGQAVPTLAGQIARSIDDTRRATFTQTGAPLAQQDKSLQKIKNKIPFLSQTSQPYVDQWGRTQENTGGSFAGRLAYNMLSPGYYSKNKPTQVDNWLQQLYDRTGESSVLPSYAQKNFTKDGIKHNLTAEQYTAYAKERGQTAYDILEVLVPGYKDLTDQQAVHATEKAYTVATEFAKQEALGIEPSKEVQNNIERAEKWGDGDWMAGIADILKANALTYNVKGDKIPGTDRTISGSAKKNKIAALVDAGYSQYQAMQLYDLLNG